MPHYFAKPAEDLVSMMRLSQGTRVLDVGTGGGAVGVAAATTVGTQGVFVGIDVSSRMLVEARRNGLEKIVVGALPHLPYSDETFDGVAASFVLSHIADCDQAAGEMVRVGKCGAIIGISSWAESPSDNDMGKEWQEVAKTFISKDTLSRAVMDALPSADRFTSTEALEDILRGAGLTQIVVKQIDYPVHVKTADYISSRVLAMSARFMKSILPVDTWKQFTDTASERLYKNFGSLLKFTTTVNLAVGVKQKI
jgi:ubiquinone/menaquinone biosynthesis C-methylase UbiE